MPKLFTFGVRKVDKNPPVQVCWRPMGASGIDFQTNKIPVKFTLIYSTLRDKPKTMEIVLGHSQKFLYNQFAQDLAFASACCRGGTFICMQAHVF